MRIALAVPLLLTGALACSIRPTTDETIPPPKGYSGQDTIAKPGSLVRRLAEAADGYRDGKPKWVVANRKPEDGHHRVVGVFSTFDQAAFVARREGPDYAAFGPYRTPADDYQYPDNERVVEVVVIYADRSEKRFSADSVDAILWTVSAFDKFVVPYLSFVSGAEYAQKQRELYLNGQSPYSYSQVVAHKRASF